MTDIADSDGAAGAIARPNFRSTLFKGLHCLSSWATAEVVWAVLRDDVLLEALESGVTLDELLKRLDGGDARATEGLLTSLRYEGIVEVNGGMWKLVPEAEDLRILRGWFDFFLEGYRPLFHSAATLAREGAGSVGRNPLHVALGSAGMAEFDAVPLVLRLIDRSHRPGQVVLDYGCGNAYYLTTLCARNPNMTAVGVEVAEEAVGSALEHVAACGMSDRISIVHASGPDYIPEIDADFVVFAFVLQEVIVERGVDGTIQFLAAIGDRFPDAVLIVIEIVDPHLEGSSEVLSKDPQGRFYNWYAWIHTVTAQRLLRSHEWIRIFSRAGFEVVDRETVDTRVDSTGFHIGYALAYVGRGNADGPTALACQQ